MKYCQKNRLAVVAVLLVCALIIGSFAGCIDPNDSSVNVDALEEELVCVAFADIQLTSNAVGSTVNAEQALYNHLSYAKSIEADVLFMPGDIVNNAVAEYYALFWKIFKSVYGEDEANYPELIWAMGNHEWYDKNEQDAPDAIKLFKSNARINTPNLVKSSQVQSLATPGTKLANYYKVVKGVPFVVISGDGRGQDISWEQEEELIKWLDEIQELPSVKAGCPVYVTYHCAIQGVTYFGQGAGSNSYKVDDILKNYPNTIVFTGDTHFPSANERTINQIDYTSINMGSSSYSRMVSCSATSLGGWSYYNMKGTDMVDEEVAFGFEYTPNLMVLHNKKDGSVSICRYISDKNPENTKKVGITWEFPPHLDTSKFVYTDARFQDKTWANRLYGKDGLEFGPDASVIYSVDKDRMMVYFDDVTDHKYAEHYVITVTSDSGESETYDVVGNYFKQYEQATRYHFQLDRIPKGTSYTVQVKAYDFFDNESLNSLVATHAEETSLFHEEVDDLISQTYSDMSVRKNYEVSSGEQSNSSLEYFYEGSYPFSYGATLGTVVKGNDAYGSAEAYSVSDWSQAVLKCKVKNESDKDLLVGLSVVAIVDGEEKWLTDFDKDYRQTVPAGGEWTELSWSVSRLFDIRTLSDISAIRLKAKPEGVTSQGCQMHFYVDELDFVDG